MATTNKESPPVTMALSAGVADVATSQALRALETSMRYVMAKLIEFEARIKKLGG